jgi:hypothetical protein
MNTKLTRRDVVLASSAAAAVALAPAPLLAAIEPPTPRNPPCDHAENERIFCRAIANANSISEKDEHPRSWHWQRQFVQILELQGETDNDPIQCCLWAFTGRPGEARRYCQEVAAAIEVRFEITCQEFCRGLNTWCLLVNAPEPALQRLLVKWLDPD